MHKFKNALLCVYLFLRQQENLIYWRA